MFFFSSRRRHTRSLCDWSSDVCSSDLLTLVEVCLVLTLLVVIGAIAVPAMNGAFARASLNGGCDLLRGAWSKARMAAIHKGETYIFRCERSEEHTSELQSHSDLVCRLL